MSLPCETPQPVVIITHGPHTGKKAVLQYERKKTWMVRLLNEKRSLIDQLWIGPSGKIEGTQQKYYSISIPKHGFSCTDEYAHPHTHTGFQSTRARTMANKYMGKTKQYAVKDIIQNGYP